MPPTTPTSPFTVRLTRPEDIDGWLDVRQRVAEEGRWIAAESPIDTKADGARARAAIDDEQQFGVVAVDADGAIIGCAGASLAPYGVAEFGMMVLDGWRGRGVGSALLEAILDWSRERGAHKVALQAWPHNTMAIALYEKYGFEREGVLLRHYRRRNGELWDALLMGLVLDTRSPGSPY